MCGAKLMEKKRTEDLMEMLGLKKTVVQMAKANGVRTRLFIYSHNKLLELSKIVINLIIERLQNTPI